MQQYLIQYTAQDIAITFRLGSHFDCLRDRAAKRSCGSRMSFQDLPSDLRRHGRRRGDRCTIGPHDFTAEGLLLIGNLDHVDFAVQSEERACHGESGPPLTGAGLSRHALEALLLRIISLCDRRIEFVASRSIVSFEFVIDMCRSIQRLLKEGGVGQR